MTFWQQFKDFYTRYWNSSLDNKIPESAETSYAISAIQTSKSFDDLYNKFLKYCKDKIKNASVEGNTEVYIKCPKWLLSEHLNKVLEELKSLNYIILYSSEQSIIISWNFKTQKR